MHRCFAALYYYYYRNYYYLNILFCLFPSFLLLICSTYSNFLIFSIYIILYAFLFFVFHSMSVSLYHNFAYVYAWIGKLVIATTINLCVYVREEMWANKSTTITIIITTGFFLEWKKKRMRLGNEVWENN